MLTQEKTGILENGQIDTAYWDDDVFEHIEPVTPTEHESSVILKNIVLKAIAWFKSSPEERD